MALLGLLVLLALARPVGATWDSCRDTCGLTPMALNESAAVPEFGSSESPNATANLDVPPGAWPGIASVQVTMENGTWHMCTGALVSQRWVVTAASCFDGAGPVVEWKVVMGATDLAQPGPEAQVFQVKQILLHQDYVAATVTNNIALLELEQPVECSDYIQLGCVPDGSLAVPELKTCYMAGWRAAPASGQCAVLQEAKVRLMDAQLCNSSRWYGGAVHPQDLCAGYPRGGIDTCQGDVGAPLVCKDNDEDNFWLVGLSSWGEGCARARRPGLFTSTQHFHGWIRAHTGPNPAAPTAAPLPTLNAPGREPPVVPTPESALRSLLEKLQELVEVLKSRIG
ncbi:PREDICTED: acrosin-like [Ficedula albicollis]|uniref:acrosin-like n=1 Tax=Ficedula albicollis TaxID=59894 RepID=UPI0007AD8D2C|nr:PREDICTED: acrosin-like [Ficedula albicollis]